MKIATMFWNVFRFFFCFVLFVCLFFNIYSTSCMYQFILHSNIVRLSTTISSHFMHASTYPSFNYSPSQHQVQLLYKENSLSNKPSSICITLFLSYLWIYLLLFFNPFCLSLIFILPFILSLLLSLHYRARIITRIRGTAFQRPTCADN